MVRGNMELPTIQQGKLKIVKINEGQVFCIPSRVPHSPQRPETGSLGLVIERERYEDASPPEVDGLRWYSKFSTPGKPEEDLGEVLWERYFHCGDLGRDLVPVVKAYMASDEYKTRVPAENVLTFDARPVVEDTTTIVPDPFDLEEWIAAHAAQLDAGESISLFGPDHPDKEFNVQVVGGGAAGSVQECAGWAGDTWVFQLRGNAAVSINGADATNSQQLLERVGGVVPPNTPYAVTRAPGSVGLVVTNDPRGNKKGE
jgi:3-hydroxyanthranilate 3,4-dioxygenase